MPLPRRLAFLAIHCAAALSAQIPVDSALVFEQTPVVSPAYYRLVDVFGRGSAQVRGQSVFMSIDSIAVDRDDPNYFYYLGGAQSFAGTWRAELWPVAEIGLNLWGPWSQTPSPRIAISQSFVVTGSGSAGDLELHDKVGNGTVQTVALPIASIADIATFGDLAYVAEASAAGALVEVDLGTGVVRSVGSYPFLQSLDVDPVAGTQLLIGTGGGDVLRVDVASGAVLGTVASGLTAVPAVGFTRVLTAVYSDGLSLWSEAAGPLPIFTSSSAILDFGVATAATASIVPFGAGCGVAAAATFAAPGTQPLPTVGNATFALGLRAGPAAQIALLAAGTSRVTWSLGALPFDLGSVGAAGCSLLISPDATLLTTTDAAGDVDAPLPIPNDPSLMGIEFVAQWFVPDPAVGPLGFATSEGAAFVIN